MHEINILTIAPGAMVIKLHNFFHLICKNVSQKQNTILHRLDMQQNWYFLVA